ncbi:nitroreductase family protein [Halosquirtibacter xylanolyticus]|uniref:nitroreductase family protein n=1 Tax=Halosquirtibacter xylanolyticus TaxID=3374599 RepID=UPI0037483322|nr:nitroreductase family protein [Prolixibacteraceae bacterium]
MIHQLNQHRSIRKYTNQPIGKDLLESILEAGIRASNTGNMQMYAVIVTEDEKQKEALSPAHFNQPMVKNAPVVLTLCADFRRVHQWCKINNADASYDDLLWLINGTIDSMLVAQNISVAAESKGLGLCYLGTTIYNAPQIIETLQLPKGVIPITTITLGWPDANPPLTNRLPMNAVVHYEKYQDFSDADIQSLYKEKEELEESIKFVKENNKDNLAQVYTDVRYKRADNAHFTKVLKETLIAQGFKL